MSGGTDAARVHAPGPVVINQLGARVGERLAAHPARPVVVDQPPDLPPWRLPSEADVLVTGPGGWRNAPAAAPPGWPHGLRWIQTASAGIDFYPPWLARGVTLSCGRGIAAGPIAEYVLAALLRFEKRLDAVAARGPQDWRERVLGTLDGRTIGLVGYGAIGREVARRANAFGARVLAVRRGPWDPAETAAFPAASLEALVAASDHLVLALPQTAGTRRLVDAALLALAKPGLHLVNVARGGLVDHDALLAALDDGRLGGATLDVTEPEPLPDGHPLYAHPDVLLTPHVAWADSRHEERLAAKILSNLTRFAAGAPLDDVVDTLRGY